MDNILQRIEKLASSLCNLFEFGPEQGLSQIESEYHVTIYNLLMDYANSDRNIVSFRNRFRRAVNEAFTFTALAGWVDGEGEGPMPPELAEWWLPGRIAKELVYVNRVFVKIKALRADGNRIKLEEFASARAMGYADSLLGVYAHAKAFAMRYGWGTWEVGPTEHCTTCLSLNGQRHRISWFVKHGYIPQEAGSGTLKCGGHKCQCTVRDDDGKIILPR